MRKELNFNEMNKVAGGNRNPKKPVFDPEKLVIPEKKPKGPSAPKWPELPPFMKDAGPYEYPIYYDI